MKTKEQRMLSQATRLDEPVGDSRPIVSTKALRPTKSQTETMVSVLRKRKKPKQPGADMSTDPFMG